MVLLSKTMIFKQKQWFYLIKLMICMQNIVRVPKKPKKTSQGGPKHCEGTKKNKKKISRPHGTQPVTTEEAGFHEAWKIVFLFFWYPHNVLGLLDLFFFVFLVPSQCFACKSLVLFSKTNVFV